VLLIVKPETVLAWHRKRFRLYWRWKSRAGKNGRMGAKMCAHNLAHKNVQNVQLKQWMQCEFFLGNLVLVDSKRVSPGIDTVGVWGSNPHAPTNRINSLRLTSTFSVTPHYAICTSTLPPSLVVLCAAIQIHSLGSSRRNSSNESGICNRNDGSSMISSIYKGQGTWEDIKDRVKPRPKRQNPGKSLGDWS
jgi:hypothetical protein